MNTLRIGRMPEANKATFEADAERGGGGGAGAAAGSGSGQAGRRGARQLELSGRTGAAGAEQRTVGRTSSTPPVSCAKATEAAYGENDAWGRMQYEKHLHVLRHDHGGVERVIRAAAVSAGQAPAQAAQGSVGLLSAQPAPDGLRGGAAARGLPIGSGVVEAACKTLVTERMKRSGMRWREAGGQAILTLRGWAQSDRFPAAWSLLSATYRGEVSLPDDVEVIHGQARLTRQFETFNPFDLSIVICPSRQQNAILESVAVFNSGKPARTVARKGPTRSLGRRRGIDWLGRPPSCQGGRRASGGKCPIQLLAAASCGAERICNKSGA